jgi:RimJ/RimL family protein N-acetyltransferase
VLVLCDLEDLEQVMLDWVSLRKSENQFHREYRLTKQNKAIVLEEFKRRIINGLVYKIVEPETQQWSGFLALSVDSTSLDKFYFSVSLTDIYLRPVYRGRGLMREAISSCAQKLEEMGVDKINLTVHPDNTQAITLYQKLGFKTVQIRYQLDLNGVDTDG